MLCAFIYWSTYFRRRPAHDHPCCRPTRRALRNSHLAAVYLWLAINKAVSRCPGRLKLFDAAKMHVMLASSSFSRLSVAGSGETWRMTNELLVSDFTRALFSHPTPGVCVALHQCLPLFARLLCRPQWGGLHNRHCFVILCQRALGELWLIRSSWVARWRRRLLSAQYWARLLRKVLGRYQLPIPPNTCKYWPNTQCPNTGIVRTVVLNKRSLGTLVAGMSRTSHATGASSG